MLQRVTHPFDQNKHHFLSLLPNPIYPEGIFNCDACGKQDNGAAYHCEECKIDLHLNCGSLPLALTHQSHAHHKLCLTYSPPYQNKIFSCDICSKSGSNHWLYRCDSCQFDAHLGCAQTNPGLVPIQTAPTVTTKSPVIDGTQFQTGTPFNNYPPNTPFNNNYPPTNIPLNNNYYAQPCVHGHARPNRGSGSRRSDIMNQVVQGLVAGATQAVGRISVRGLVGHGGGGRGDGQNDYYGDNGQNDYYGDNDGGGSVDFSFF